MSRKHFSLLLVLTVVFAALVLLMPAKTGRESSLEPSVFLPGVAARVNDVDWLRLTSAGGVTVATLKREGSAWVVEEASGYRADWTRLKALLSGLSKARVIEAKTANPEFYSRLGVEDVDLPEAGGVMIEFSAESGLPAVIVGNSAQGRDGQYARLRNSTGSVLLDRRLDVATGRSGWLDSDIIDVSAAEVVEVEIIHPDGETIRAVKASADDEDFVLQEIPKGREIKSAWNVNSLAGAQVALALEEVTPADNLDWSDAIRFGLLTADGLLLESELLAVVNEIPATTEDAEAETEYWMRLQAGIYTSALENAVEAAGDDNETATRAGTINDRVNGWAYRIPGYKYESMTRRMGDLLQSVE